MAYLERYRDLVDPPLREGVTVTRVGAGTDTGEQDGLTVETTEGTAAADQVVLAVNGYHVPRVPRLAERLPRSVQQLHSEVGIGAP